MCTRAAVLVSLVGTVWGCGSLKDPCVDKGHKLNEGEKLTKTVTCHTYGLYPQLFEGGITTTSADVNLTIYSVKGDKTTTLVEPTQLSDSSPWIFPADKSKCNPINTCYIGKSSNHINVDIVCVTKGGCEVDVSLSAGCGNSGTRVDCVLTDWTQCSGELPGPCYQIRFKSASYNGGTECDGPTREECACPGAPVTPPPTHSPGYTPPPTNSPTRSPTESPVPPATRSPTHPGDTSAPAPKSLSPSSSPVASSSSSKLPIIIGAAGGGAVVLGVIVGVVIWHLKCRKPKDGEEGLLNEQPQEEDA